MLTRKAVEERAKAMPTSTAKSSVEALHERKEETAEKKCERELTAWLRTNAVKGTEKAYSPYQKQFQTFCEERTLQPFPAAPATVGAFLQFLLEERKLSRSSINVAASAVAAEYKLSDFPSPTVSPLVRAVKKTIARRTLPSRAKKPLTLEILARIVENAKPGDWLDGRDNFILVLLFSAALRESEEMGLGAEDVWMENMNVRGKDEEILCVFVEKSKNDQRRIGHTRLIAAASDTRVCPVHWFKSWQKARNKDARQLFHAERGIKKLSNSTPNSRLKVRLERIGLDAKEFGSHSGRRGMITAAAEKGVAERLLQRHGNWKSDAVRLYIDESVENRLAVSTAVLRDAIPVG